MITIGIQLLESSNWMAHWLESSDWNPLTGYYPVYAHRKRRLQTAKSAAFSGRKANAMTNEDSKPNQNSAYKAIQTKLKLNY